jgi:hypothetical protein
MSHFSTANFIMIAWKVIEYAYYRAYKDTQEQDEVSCYVQPIVFIFYSIEY